MRSLLLSLSLTSMSVCAQDPVFVHLTPRDQYLFPEEMPLSYILGGNVALREGPSRSSRTITTLSAGTPITIEEGTTDTLIVNGVGSHWYRVKAGKHQGLTWGGQSDQRTFGSTAD
ncbi:MAG: SH3 domain-containing protein, partial [Flavobacteriales bacterium]